MVPARIDGDAADEIIADFGPLGLRVWNGGLWSLVSADNPEWMITADVDGNGVDEASSTSAQWVCGGGRREPGLRYLRMIRKR